MKNAAQAWKIGDVFAISLDDQSYAIGQIIGREAQVLNSASIALFDIRVENTSISKIVLSLDRLYSVLFVTRDQLDDGTWKVIGEASIGVSPQDFPYESLRRSGFVGAKVIGSGIVRNFVRAFYGFCAWNFYLDPEYFDRLLISPAKRPTQLVFKDKANNGATP
jgi:hypothetical protein